MVTDYNYYCDLNDGIFKKLIYNYITNNNEGEELYMPLCPNAPSNKKNCPSFVTNGNSLGLISCVGCDASNRLIDFKNLMNVIHTFYFLDNMHGKNYNMRYKLMANGVFKLYIETKEELKFDNKGNRMPWDQYDLSSVKTTKKNFTPIGHNSEINDFYWKSYINPIFSTSYIDPKTNKPIIFGRNEDAYRYNKAMIYNLAPSGFANPTLRHCSF